ncbi:hypothetical protein [Streptomyces sp. NPDC059247]|uniref:hypothetical protein n=1 Tax=Streptomyces sp. NPDC059247 TaxID=3346790 RepID=UPI0036CDD5FF
MSSRSPDAFPRSEHPYGPGPGGPGEPEDPHELLHRARRLTADAHPGAADAWERAATALRRTDGVLAPGDHADALDAAALDRLGPVRSIAGPLFTRAADLHEQAGQRGKALVSRARALLAGPEPGGTARAALDELHERAAVLHATGRASVAEAVTVRLSRDLAVADLLDTAPAPDVEAAVLRAELSRLVAFAAPHAAEPAVSRVLADTRALLGRITAPDDPPAALPLLRAAVAGHRFGGRPWCAAEHEPLLAAVLRATGAHGEAVALLRAALAADEPTAPLRRDDRIRLLLSLARTLASREGEEERERSGEPTGDGRPGEGPEPEGATAAEGATATAEGPTPPGITVPAEGPAPPRITVPAEIPVPSGSTTPVEAPDPNGTTVQPEVTAPDSITAPAGNTSPMNTSPPVETVEAVGGESGGESSTPPVRDGSPEESAPSAADAADEELALLVEAVRLADRVGSDPRLGVCARLGLGLAYLERGRAREAVAFLERAVAGSAGDDDTAERVRAGALLAYCALLLGEPHRAAVEYARAAETALDRDDPRHAAALHRRAGQAFGAAGAAAEAARSYRRADELYRTHGEYDAAGSHGSTVGGDNGPDPGTGGADGGAAGGGLPPEPRGLPGADVPVGRYRMNVYGEVGGVGPRAAVAPGTRQGCV